MNKPLQRPTHSRIGASGAHRWMHCPGSVSLGGDDTTSEYAAEGTAAHQVAAECLEKGEDAWEHLGRRVEADGFSFKVDAAMVDAVQLYLDTVRASGKGLLLVEVGFDLSKYHEGMYGTADAVHVGHDKLTVFDFKYGQGVGVDVKDNPQLLYYAAGAADHVHDMDDDFGGPAVPETIEVVVVQPRHDHDDGPVRRWSLSVDQLGEWVESELLPAVRATSGPNPVFEEGEWCQFCPGRTRCPLLTEAFDDALASDEDPGRLETPELALRAARIASLRTYMKALEDEVANRLMKGEIVPGFKLVPKRSNRVWGDGAEEAAKAKFGREAYTTPALKSPAQIDALPDGKAFTKEYAYKPDSGLAVAPDTDKRSAVPQRTAAEVFANV